MLSCVCSGPLSPYRIVRFIRCLNPSDWAIGLCMCVVCVFSFCVILSAYLIVFSVGILLALLCFDCVSFVCIYVCVF